ncbi:phage tail protein, partial [Acinetobacter baumannii]|uniref:phage tail protein n=1 Tax=Acinetobacter baumannii TaxID=470 RepID=UPI001D179B31
MKTQIKGFGKKKEDDTYYFAPITYTSKQSEKWGIRVQSPVSDDRYTVSENMLERLKQDLQDYPTITGTVTMKWRVEPNKGDYVAFVYEPLGVNTYIQVVGIKTYPAIPN